MRIERNLGADVIMQFDHVVPGQSDEPSARDAMERTCAGSSAAAPSSPAHARVSRCADANAGALSHRAGRHSCHRCAANRPRAIAAMDDWAGIGIGGLSVGEAKPDMYAMLEVVDGELPPIGPGT